MNRLWVRLTLVFFLILIFMSSIPPVLAIISNARNPVPDIAELAAQGENEKIIEILDGRQQDVVNLITIALIIGGLFGVMVSVRFSRTLTRPLDRLSEAAANIQQKDFSVRVPEEGTEEFQAVTKSFNNMASQLEKAEELRRNLLSDVAHELRHPLHVIRGNIEAMIDGVFPRSDDELQRLLKQTEMLTTLVDDLRELAHAEADQLQLNLTSTEIAKLLDETVNSYKTTAAEKNISLELALLGKLPTLNIDSARIQQVIINLLSNAVRYTPENGHISISAEQTAGYLEVKIKDNGAGIAPESLPYIFDRFYRSDKARVRNAGGTGLGLAIVKALTEAHNGTVSVSSQGLGHGSEFQLRLPLK